MNQRQDSVKKSLRIGKWTRRGEARQDRDVATLAAQSMEGSFVWLAFEDGGLNAWMQQQRAYAISIGAAAAFGRRQGLLCLRDVRRLSAGQAAGLSRHRGALLFHSLEIDDVVAFLRTLSDAPALAAPPVPPPAPGAGINPFR
mgnify:CR=1 FL=1